jgi:hypothetical protein
MSLEINSENEFKTPNYVTNGITQCVDFWKREGELAIANNKSGKWGNKESQEMAKTMEGDDFIMDLLLLDCKAFVNSDFAKESGDKYECGRTRSHVWVHCNDNRIMMISVKKFTNN